MKLHQWTSLELEPYLGGDAEYLRNTYFGEWILTPERLSTWHQESVAQVPQRWQPEVHQVVDAERRLRETLGDAASWTQLARVAEDLRKRAKNVRDDQKQSVASVAKYVGQTATVAEGSAKTLEETLAALRKGDLNLLQQLISTRLELDPQVARLPRQLRALRQPAALSVANVVADMRLARRLLQDLNLVIGKGLIAVVAEAGCGKTQLSAQLTAPSSDRPTGVLLHGRSLNAGDSLDSVAARLSMSSGVPVPSMEALLAAVDAAGQRTGRRLPIVIDGLNEAEDPRDWKALLASLQHALRRYPNVLVVCTLRGAFAQSALPHDLERVNIEGFGEDTVDAIVRYFRHYKITSTDAALPFELLKHPLTLRLFCEVTNLKREHSVGIETAPGSLSALFDRYLEQATERIMELAPRARQFERGEVSHALDEIGISLWTEKTRTLDVGTLRQTLDEASRPWKESIVSALELEGVILRYPGEPPGGQRLGAAYDLLAGHLAATAILARQSASGLEAWAKDPATAGALGGPEWHPLAHDIFLALSGLAPRRLGKQLWAVFDVPLRQKALRAAADLEGKYLDQETIAELTKLVVEGSTGTVEIFERLWTTRSMPGYPLNARFLDRVLGSMSMAKRDLRWTEWLRRERMNILSDVRWLEKRWRGSATEGSEPDALRARWVMWILTSTVRDLRDQATRTLYWFGRGNTDALFTLTIESLPTNDPYVSERMLAASYGTAMALQNGKGAYAFRDERLPRFAKIIFDLMFGESAPLSTTHSLRREYAKGIIEVALRWRPGLLTSQEKSRIAPPFTGGIRNWRRRPDYDAGKYRNGNDPLGFDWKNYTMGSLARKRSTYDFNHPDFLRVKEEVLWRIHDLGYSLQQFGDIDAEIIGSRHLRRAEPAQVDRYGKKYSWIAFYELCGFRSDEDLLERKAWRGFEPHPEEIDIDPSFPDEPGNKSILGFDILGQKHPDAVRWVSEGPIPSVKKWLFCTIPRLPKQRWALAHGSVFSHGGELGRTGYLRIRAFFLAETNVAKLRRFLRSKKVEFGMERDTQVIGGFFAGEFPWHKMIRYAEPEYLRLPKGRLKVPSPQLPEIVLSFGEEEFRIGGQETPAWRYETIYETLEIVPLAQMNRFDARTTQDRPSGLVPSKQIGEFSALWLGLPAWTMLDDGGQPTSIAFARPGTLNSESSLLVRADVIRAYMKFTRSRLVWIVSGERQRMSSSGMNAAYKQYLQVFFVGRRGIEKLFELRDQRSE